MAKIEIPDYMITEMNSINLHLSQFPNYKKVASSLGKFYSNQSLVAGLVGCIIPESGSDHTVINATEFRGQGASGTQGWNCGEGLVGFTYWKYKIEYIKRYNSDSRATQKLPTNWKQYSQGKPIIKGKNHYYAVQDGRHIAGLSFDNHILFLTKFYINALNKLNNEENLAVIVAKIYQEKAGIGFYKEISDPVLRAYTTAKNKYPAKAGNTYLTSLKCAAEYLNAPIQAGSVPARTEFVTKLTESELNNKVDWSANPFKNETINQPEMSSLKVVNGEKSGILLGYHMKSKNRN